MFPNFFLNNDQVKAVITFYSEVLTQHLTRWKLHHCQRKHIIHQNVVRMLAKRYLWWFCQRALFSYHSRYITELYLTLLWKGAFCPVNVNTLSFTPHIMIFNCCILQKRLTLGFVLQHDHTFPEAMQEWPSPGWLMKWDNFSSKKHTSKWVLYQFCVKVLKYETGSFVSCLHAHLH